MEKCPVCGSRFFSKNRFRTINLNGKDYLVCPFCQKKNKLVLEKQISKQEKKWNVNITKEKIVVIAITTISGFLATLFIESYDKFDHSIYRAVIGLLVGAITGWVVVESTKEQPGILFRSKYQLLGIILGIGFGGAIITGILGGFLADMNVIEMSVVEGVITGVLIGSILPSVGMVLVSSSRRFLRTIGCCILGGAILCVFGFLLYSMQRYVGPFFTTSIEQPSDLFIIAFMGIVLGVILGGILGYLNFNLGSLRNKMPLVFVAISPLLTAPIGFIIGGFYFLTEKTPQTPVWGSTATIHHYVTPFGVFMLIIIWAVIGLIAGIATVALKIKQKEGN